MKIRYLIEGEQVPREINEPAFNFEEYKAIMLGEKTDKHQNALNDVFIGNRSYKRTSILWLEVLEEVEENEES